MSSPDSGGGGIFGFFSNFFTYGKEQDIIRTQVDAQKYFQQGKYTPTRNYDIFIVVLLVVTLLALIFFFRNK